MDLPVIRPTIGAETLDSTDRQTLTGVAGQPVAAVHTTPPLLVQFALRRLARQGAEAVPPGVFTEAGRLFATATLDGDSPHDYCDRAACSSGVPRGVYQRALRHIQAELAYLDSGTERPESAAIAPSVEATVHWVPRGRVLAVICPSNHPEPHVTWVRGLAAGYRVLVRPGSADPFTPVRLSAALVKAGLPANRLALLPSDHTTADVLVRAADRAIVYGGPAAARRWASDPAVLVRGPGFSKVLVDRPLTDALVGHLAEAVAGDGGVRCTNISVIRTSGDTETLANALAARLGTTPARPVTCPDAVLPAVSATVAEAVRDQIGGLLAGGLIDHTGYAPDPFVVVADGSLVARPVVLAAPPSVAVPEAELPIPFAIVAPWRREDGLPPLRNSLVLNVIGDSPMATAVDEPTIRKVVHGVVPPWYTAPGLPHDGSITDFLLEPKTVLREVEP